MKYKLLFFLQGRITREPLEKKVLSPEELLDQLIDNFDKKENEYFDEKTKKLIKKNFDLFDRDGNGYINWEEVKETIISLNYEFKEEDLLKKLFLLFEKEEDLTNKKGINFRNFLILLSKENKERDLQTILLNAFKVLDPESNGFILSEEFKELLIYNGYRYNNSQVEKLMRFADPKNTGKLQYYEFIKKISNLNPKKKRKRKKNK